MNIAHVRQPQNEYERAMYYQQAISNYTNTYSNGGGNEEELQQAYNKALEGGYRESYIVFKEEVKSGKITTGVNIGLGVLDILGGWWKDRRPSSTSAPSTTAPKPSSNVGLYVGLGVGLVALIGIGYLIVKKS